MPRWLKTGFWALNLVIILTGSNIWLLAARQTDKLFGNVANVDPKLWADTQVKIMETYMDSPMKWLLMVLWGYLVLALIYLIESIAKSVVEKAERGT